jgi:hypothetical protein
MREMGPKGPGVGPAERLCNTAPRPGQPGYLMLGGSRDRCVGQQENRQTAFALPPDLMQTTATYRVGRALDATAEMGG